jgi:AhpD family alkylhydroperoxidase
MKDYKNLFEQVSRMMKELENEIPETMAGYDKMQRNHSMNGALSAKTKELIALGISITTQCEECIVSHLHHAIEGGTNRAEILEVISVAIMMGGAPVMAYAGHVLEAMNQLLGQKEPARLYDHTPVS